jgi:hypothetical protein
MDPTRVPRAPLLRPKWLRSRLMSSWPQTHPPPWPPSRRPGPPHCLHWSWRAGDERARHEPGAAGAQPAGGMPAVGLEGSSQMAVKA